jgi:7-carboxy-7-deazaguanine synthase
LKFEDQVKFVITDRADYEWSRFKIDTLQLNERVGDVLFSPVYEVLEPLVLADWVLADGLNVRMQIQLHKVLWGDKPGV